MPRSAHRVRLEAGVKLRLPRLMQQGFLLPDARTFGQIRWTYTGTDIESGFATLSANLTAPPNGWLKVQMDNFEQWIELRSKPRRFGGRQWYFECPVTVRLVTTLWLPNGARRFASRHAWPGRVAHGSQFQTRMTGRYRAHSGFEDNWTHPARSIPSGRW